MRKRFFIHFGDICCLLSQAAFSGVGIWESGSLLHILCMTLPLIGFWEIFAHLLQIYQHPEFAASARSCPDEAADSFIHHVKKSISRVISKQRPIRAFICCLVSSLCGVLYLIFYWQVILHTTHGWFFSPRLILWYCQSSLAFFILWRFVYTFFSSMRCLSRVYSFIRIAGQIFFIGVFIYLLPVLVLNIKYAPQRITVDEAKNIKMEAALVFGAGVYRDNRPSGVLQDRIETAVDLYNQGSVDYILMSGDNAERSRYETDVMTAYAIELGIPEEKILQDEYGYSTIDSIRNAKEKFGIDTILAVSQQFHETRILLICDEIGLDAYAVGADRGIYNIFEWIRWYIRDIFGVTMTWVKFTFLK